MLINIANATVLDFGAAEAGLMPDHCHRLDAGQHPQERRSGVARRRHRWSDRSAGVKIVFGTDLIAQGTQHRCDL